MDVEAQRKNKSHNMIWNGLHDCAPSSLCCVLPVLEREHTRQAFIFCCAKWPDGGVTNKEFNIVLRYLDLQGKFEYCDSEEMTLSDFLVDQENVYILLLYGHFTVIRKGVIDDLYPFPYSEKSTVFCYWKLLIS